MCVYACLRVHVSEKREAYGTPSCCCSLRKLGLNDSKLNNLLTFLITIK